MDAASGSLRHTSELPSNQPRRRHANASQRRAPNSPKTTQGMETKIKPDSDVDDRKAESSCANVGQGKTSEFRTVLKSLSDLHLRHEMSDKKIRQLETDIADGKLACGRMTQELLRCQEALRLRETHVQEDSSRLQQELQQRSLIEAEVKELLERTTTAGID